jgi:hypothetical protein
MNSGRRPTRRSSSATRSARSVLHAIDQQRLADIVEQGHARIERAERVLEDHLDLGPERQQLALRQGREIDHLSGLGAVEDLAAGRIDRPQDAARGGGLAAAALAHQAQCLALFQGEIDAVDRTDMANHALEETVRDREELLQATDLEQRVTHDGSAMS